MSEFVLLVLSVVAGVVVGGVVHELTHYLVLLLGGRGPTLAWPSIQNRRLTIRTQFNVEGGVGWVGRVAAIAPLPMGLVWLLICVSIGAVQSPWTSVFALVSALWVAKLTRSDLRVAAGRVKNA